MEVSAQGDSMMFMFRKLFLWLMKLKGAVVGFGLPHSTSQYSTKVIRSSEIIIHDLRLCKQQISRRECQCLATTCSYSLRHVSHSMLVPRLPWSMHALGKAVHNSHSSVCAFLKTCPSEKCILATKYSYQFWPSPIFLTFFPCSSSSSSSSC